LLERKKKKTKQKTVNAAEQIDTDRNAILALLWLILYTQQQQPLRLIKSWAVGV
jgi:hypothetical protein